jgi:Zinc finger C-x8-C-x5-C-x3-H type (and similar)
LYGHAAAASFEDPAVSEEVYDPMSEPYEPMDIDYSNGPGARGAGMPMQVPGMIPPGGAGLLPEPGGMYQKQAALGGWRGGGGPRFPHHHRGGDGGREFRGGPPGRGFRGGHPGRGGGGFHRGGGSSNFSDRFNSDRKPLGRGGRGSDRGEERGGRTDFRDGFPPPRRPCKFWVEKGFCREEDRCKFPHPR